MGFLRTGGDARVGCILGTPQPPFDASAKPQALRQSDENDDRGATHGGMLAQAVVAIEASSPTRKRSYLGGRGTSGASNAGSRPGLGRLARALDLHEYQGKELFGRYGIPSRTGGSPTPLPRRVTQRRSSACGGRQGTSADWRPGQGRRNQGGRERCRGRGSCRRHPRDGHPRSLRHELWIERTSDIERQYYLSLTFDRSAKQRSSSSRPRAASTSRGRRDETRHSFASVDPLEAPTLAWKAPGVRRRRRRPRRASRSRRSWASSTRPFTGLRGDVVRDQPADRHS